MRKKKNLMYWFLPITCFLGNISQLPIYSGLTQGLFKVLWVVMLVCAFLLQNKNLYIHKTVFSFAATINLLLFFLSYTTGKGYFSSYLLSNINLCVFVALVAYMVGLNSDESILYPTGLAYVFSALFCGIWVYFQYFYGVDWLNTSSYLYAGKNSLATILLCAMLLSYFLLRDRYKVLTFLTFLVTTILIFVMKSRATIVCTMLFFFYVAVIRTRDYKKKLLAILFLLGVAGFVLYNPVAHEIVIENILFNNKDVTDISAVTSNRDQFIQRFVENFPAHWILGLGYGFLECFPLSILYNFGVVGAIPIFALSVYPIRVGCVYKKQNPTSVMPELLIIMNLMLWINGLFEEQPPFGPGVKCSLLWLFMGVLLGFARRQKEDV